MNSFIRKIMYQYHKEIVQKGIFQGILDATFYYWGDIIALLQRLVGKIFVQVQPERIAFMSTPDYADNARALSEYIVSRNEKFDILWFVSNPRAMRKQYPDLPVRFYAKERIHNHYRWKSLMAAYSCGTIFYTHNFILYREGKKKEQTIVNLWHGCGYKDSEKEKTKKKNLKFDYALVPGKLFIPTKAEFFCAEPKTILPIGYPRYDLMLNESCLGKKYAEQLKSENTDCLIIWMPTFRKSVNMEFPEDHICYGYDIPLCRDINDLFEIDRICKEEGITVCIKRHPMQQRYSCEEQEFNRIKFISNEDLTKIGVQLYEIIQYTDGLVSDYSSISIDYLLLDKPIAFSLDDYELYKRTRGFVFEDPLSYMPGEHLYNVTDLIHYLKSVADGEDRYKEERSKLCNIAHNPTSQYSARIFHTFLQKEKKWESQEHRKQ